MEPCNVTPDQDYTPIFTALFGLFKENNKDELKRQVHQHFGTAPDPHRMALVCIKQCPGLFVSKSNSFAAIILVELDRFIGEGNNKERFNHCLTEDLQVEAFEVAMHQKNAGVTRLFVRCFQLVKVKDTLTPLLRNALKSDMRKVCLMATLLGVQPHFSASELVVPLFLANRLPDADEFLDSSPSHQKEFLLLLDGLLNEDTNKSSDSEKKKAKNAKNMRDPKVICDTIGKLIKRYSLSSAMCPNFKKCRALGGLRFMFHKYYAIKDMPKSAFYSLIDDTVKEYPDISNNLLKLFNRHNDLDGAVYYVVKLKVPDENIPYGVKVHMEMYPELLEESQHQVDNGQLPQAGDEEVAPGCYSLTLPDEDIILVDSMEMFEECAGLLRASPLLAVDAEWKPIFGTGPVEQAALLQFATATKVYLIDLIVLQPLLQDHHWRSIGELFSNPQIRKLGYGINSDYKVLSDLHPEMKKGVQGSKKVTDLDVRKGVLLDRYPNIFSYADEKHKGLSDMVYRCFGLPLDKREGFSNWAARPLNKSQVVYAASDARCLIDIYNYLNERATKLGIPDWIYVAKKAKSEDKKKLKPAAKGKEVDEVVKHQVNRNPVNAAEFQVVCDTMLQGLAKKLRSCGVDARALENGEPWDRCFWYFEKEMRVILTRGSNYFKLRKYVPEEYMYCVKSENAQDQMEEVIQSFKVKVTVKDVFARCSKCNSKSYIVVPSSVISAMQSGVTSIDKARGAWVECEGGTVNVMSGFTANRVRVQFEMVPKPVVEGNDTFYICSVCGWCYWEGSHHSKVLAGRLKNVVIDDGGDGPEGSVGTDAT
ncbi:exonuclease mut-7 homolog [Eriocheir sinensis]|uniref:exonuclease mut-7 homolog n=1 Tax=Eriocheir sinensis TaxID=95602 RepID=UPI0021C5B303|nr:exonuclease mut-7 homolog [Eriocheir sinensis]